MSQDALEYNSFLAQADNLTNQYTSDWGSTAAQVGGFANASAVNNGDGSVTYTIPSTAGINSFYFHQVPDSPFTFGPMRNINQVFNFLSLLIG